MLVTSTILADARHVAGRHAETLEPMGGSTLLVTGASGFLMSYVLDVVAAWNDLGRGPACRLIAVDNLSSGLADRVAHLVSRPEVRFLEHDVSTRLDPGEPVRWVVHGATMASPTFYRRFPLETIDVNVSGTRWLLELARDQDVAGMVYMSSSEIYGDPDPSAIPTSEDYRGIVSCTGPRACYDESKRIGETLATVYHRLHDTPVTIIRPFNVYGPGQRLDDGRVVPDLLSAALERRPLVLLSDGRPTRSFCYARDAAAGILCALVAGQRGAPYNVGNDHEVSMAQLAQAVVDAAGPPALSIEYRTSADPDYLTDNPNRRCPDLARLRSVAEWAPEVGLATGLTRTLASHREALDAASVLAETTGTARA